MMVNLEQKVRWIERSDKTIDPRDFYRDHYVGLTRDELREADPILFYVLRLRRLIDSVPLEKPIVNEPQKSKSRNGDHKKVARPPSLKRPWGDDPVSYYCEQYPGVTRKALEQKNPRLYKRLWRDHLLDVVPKESIEDVQKKLRSARRRNSRFGEDARAYYLTHYRAMSRGILKRKDPALYQRLRADNLLQHVPRITTDFGDDPFAYYKKHYSGYTRGELKKRHKSLYERLRVDRSLEKLPLKCPVRLLQHKQFK